MHYPAVGSCNRYAIELSTGFPGLTVAVERRVWDHEAPVKPEELPTILPLFPLEQPLLLPGTVVPFLTEGAAGRNLVDDAFAADRYVAVIQPLETDFGAAPLAGKPAVYAVGCLAYLGEYH